MPSTGQHGSNPTHAPSKSVTRADVARLAGVSTAVVSYVLNDGPKPVAERTRAKVLDAVRALNYRPNAAARTLSRGTADTIGMLVSDSRNPFFSQLIYAIDRHARSRNQTVIVISTENSSRTLVQHFTSLASQQVRGVISFHSMTDSERTRVAAIGLPTVLVNQTDVQPDFPSIRVDYRRGARVATEHLIEHGYRTIGFIGAEEGARVRENGWADALTAAGLPTPRPYMTEFSLAGGYRAGRLLAADATVPDAVFISSDQMAMGALSAFYEAGIRVPADLAAVSFDGTAQGAYLSPALTTVRQPFEEIARATVDSLLGDTDATTVDQVMTTELLIRGSCGCGPGVTRRETGA